MKKIVAFFSLMLSITTPALAHNVPGNPAHVNPHWLPGVLCVGALIVFVILFAISDAISNRNKD